MFLGIDLGTSAVKAMLVDDAGALSAESSAPLSLSRPQPGWSEQAPGDWWTATRAALAAFDRKALHAVRGIGLSGQMHGAVLVDSGDRVIRPAILWNDGRAASACRELERREPAARTITGNRAMPGFTAPKLIWVAQHEPAHFRRVARVLLPKDWLRWRLTGETVSEPSDASGTLWLDVAQRRWSPAMLAACGLDERQMPRLVESTAVSAVLSRTAADELGLRPGVPLAGGGSDNACGAAGVGVVAPGDALLSLGTSGVVFVVDDRMRPDPARAVHAFCHCLPATWHRMAVVLSGAQTLSFAARLTGAANEAELLARIEAAGIAAPPSSRLVMLPYLTGERTPHDDPAACGVLFGLDPTTTPEDAGRAALEGVAFALADGVAALEVQQALPATLDVIGGGARSKAWGRIIAAALGRTLVYRRGGEAGPARGAALLARIAVDRLAPADACPKPAVTGTVEPDPALAASLKPRMALFRRLYADLRPGFAASAADD